MELLNVHNVKKEYKNRNNSKFLAVDGVSFSVEEGKCIGLVGESGCGKSTLGKMIVGLEEITEGNIIFQGEQIKQKKYKNKFKRELQMAFQDSFDAVNRRNTACQIISEPLTNYYNISKKEIEEKVDDLLEKVGICSSERDKYPYQFSGGQLQRICIARTLAANPKLVVLDEPLSSLDVSVQAQILNLLSDLKRDLNLTYILISHDLEAVYYLSDSIIVMYGGKIMEQIDNIEDFHNMNHPYTRRLLASSPSYKSRLYNENIEDLRIENTDNKTNGCPYFARCVLSSDECEDICPPLREIKKGHKIACHVL
ncbi:MAG: ABC transporter ATP-binding protein [Terrisporobacter sp.]|uniref:ABC transporter ATP-binding protein n=1 Tax=Terrisporobacter sp. TaxID=1965305 RepID=UPI002FC8CB2F